MCCLLPRISPGKGSGKQLIRVTSQACAAAHVRVATTAELNRAATAARVKLKGKLSIDQAAQLVERGGFAGAVMFRKASSGAFAQLVDPHGQVTLERLVRVKRGAPVEADAAAFASAIAEALTAPPPPLEPAPPVVAAVPSTLARVETLPPPPIPPPPTPESADTAAALAGPETVAPRSMEPAAGYFFRLGFAGGPAERRFSAPGFSYVTGYPYAEGGASLELFPFRAFGLGLMSDFSFGRVSDRIVGGGIFNSNDVRADVALAWRARLFAGHYGTYLIPRLGYGFREFVAPASSGFPRDERSFLVAGLEISQPIVPRYLRISGGIAALPFSRLEGAAQSTYGTSSSFGLEWMGELGGDIIGGLEWALSSGARALHGQLPRSAKDERGRDLHRICAAAAIPLLVKAGR